jgi:hypothetical protein
MDSWQRAIRAAEDAYNPTRELLYLLYKESLRDAHLFSQIDTHIKKVLEEAFVIVSADDSENIDKERTKLLKRPWFFDFCRLALEQAFWGHSLIEFGRFVPSRSKLMPVEFGSVKLFDRMHVKPELGLIVAYPQDTTGIPFREEPWNTWFIESGTPDNLGALSIAAKPVIRKENAMTDWSIRSERFGMPITFLKTASRDKKEIDTKEDFLRNLGSNAYAILDDTDIVELAESTQQDAYKIYLEMVNIQNSELSKVIAGQTGTTDEKAHVGAAEVHERILETYITASMRFLEFEINYKLIPFLIDKGYPLSGFDFMFEHFRNKQHAPKPETNPENPLPSGEGRGGAEEEGNKALKKKSLIPRSSPLSFGEGQGVRLKSAEDDLLTLIESVALSVFQGKLNSGELSPELYDIYIAEFMQALHEGYGGTLLNFTSGSQDAEMLIALQNSARVFAAHKDTQIIQALNAALLDDKGDLKPWAQFRQDALQIHADWNVTWLKTEYTQALLSAQAARKWVAIEAQRDLFPLLRYRTVGDANVRDSHRALEGITLPIEHEFWNTQYPPNGWLCRCFVNQVEEGEEITPESELNNLPAPATGFAFNVGKERKLFDSRTHPYFQNISPQNKKELENYGNYRLLNENKAFATAKQKIENSTLPASYPALTTEEITAIHFYTTPQYLKINRQLRTKKQREFTTVLTQVITAALVKIQPYIGEVYRIDHSDLIPTHILQALADYQAGNTVFTDKAFLSSTYSAESLREIDKKMEALKYKVYFKIESKSGRVIEQFSNKGTIFNPNENQREVLFAPNTKFQITYFVQNSNTFTVHLTEL